ncbi:MAG: lytic transglycosylase domain-containing protein, partial [Saprospiraceae bacterium]
MNNHTTFLSFCFLFIGSYASVLLANAPLTIKEKLEIKGPYAVLPSPKTGSETYTDADLRKRLAETKSEVIRPRLTPGVKSYVRTYTQRRRESTEVMIGRSAIYFPIFEKHLREAGLPTDLKYLPIVESALKPEARSPVGAGGLWQFMPSTGKMYGLKINSYVDERSDPNKASKAAADFLGDLYRQYGDWALVLAAYNAGPGRVNKAIRKGKSKNFWKIQKYLPKETQNYVPGFIAATYLMQNYEAHGMTAVMPEYDLQVTETTQIYSDMTFEKIAEVSRTPYYIVKALNPSYKKEIIKANAEEGAYLILPYT